MRGSYEQEWQNKFTGVSVAPSDAVWENIAAKMDTSHGRRNWVTILLIAATVTVAFAFPLTIGNSSFESRPIEDQYVLDSEQNNSSLNSTAAEISEAPSTRSVSTVSSSITPNKNNQFSGNLESVPVLAEQKLEFNISPETQAGYTLADIDFSTNLTIASLDNHYVLPVFVKKDKADPDGLMLLGRLGSGSNAVNEGISGAFASSDALFGTANVESRPDMNQFNDYRTEEGGTTYNIGFGIELPLGRKWRLVTGLGYMNQQAPGTSNVVKDNSGSYSPIGAYDPIEPGTVFLTTPYNYTASNSYVNIPVQVKYPFIDRRVKFRVGMGLSTDLMIAHAINSEEFGNSSTQPGATNYNQVGLAGLLNLDFRINLTNSYALAFETGIRKGFTPIVKSGSIYPTSFNLGVVLFYQLGK